MTKTVHMPTPLAKLPAPKAHTRRYINMVDLEILQLAAPNTSETLLKPWVEPLKLAMLTWGIDTIREIASFLANASHECAGFTRFEENLNYSAKRLTEVWPGRFPSLTAARPYERNPKSLANLVYANRMGNGPPSSGDGWLHRGYGPFQLTGKRNHLSFATAVGLTLTQEYEYIRTPIGGAMSAGWYWFENGMDVKAATPGIEDDRKAIQGGLLGVNEVRIIFNKIVSELLRLEKKEG